MGFLEWKTIAGGALVLVGLVLQQVGLEPCGIQLSEFGKDIMGIGSTVAGAVMLKLAPGKDQK